MMPGFLAVVVVVVCLARAIVSSRSALRIAVLFGFLCGMLMKEAEEARERETPVLSLSVCQPRNHVYRAKA